MSGTAVGKTETGKDSSDGSEGRQWTDSRGFHFLEYGIGPVGAAPVIAIEPRHCDDFFDFNLAERCAVHSDCCWLSRFRRGADIFILAPPD